MLVSDLQWFKQVHNKYTGEDFDEDLRAVLRRSGCKDEKIAFILDESNVLDSGFLERMNTLLANGEVPGLFEGQYKVASILYVSGTPFIKGTVKINANSRTP